MPQQVNCGHPKSTVLLNGSLLHISPSSSGCSAGYAGVGAGLKFWLVIKELFCSAGVGLKFKLMQAISDYFLGMIVKPTSSSELLKEEVQAPTEASWELAGENGSIAEWKQEAGAEDEVRRGENKLKYRKLRQKLNSMGFHHDDKCVVNKDFSSPKKQRIMKLALDFDKMAKIQNRDYEALELTAREICRMVENKHELDLQLLRQSRFVPALFELLQKVPSLHKAEFSQLHRGLETCFRILHNFAAMAVNREYLILTNRLNGLVSFTSWVLARDDKRPATRALLNIQGLAFKLVNSLLLHKSREEDIVTITDTTVQLILCSPIFKKIKTVITEQFAQEDMLMETETVIEMLRFILFVLRRSQPKLEPVHSLILPSYQETSKDTPPNEPRLISNTLPKLIEFLIPFLLGYFNQLQETEQPLEGEDFIESYPTAVENIMGIVVKIINSCFEVSFISFKKVFAELNKEGSLLSVFLERAKMITKYCKREMEEYNDSTAAKNLLNQIIILMGYLGLDDQSTQRRIYESTILEEIFNLPVQYIMDSHLRDIYIPSFCSLIFDNKTNLNQLLKDNSPQPIIKVLKKEIMGRPSLTRKTSTSSLVSFAVISPEYNSPNYETQRLSLEMRFPEVYWECLCNQLEKHV